MLNNDLKQLKAGFGVFFYIQGAVQRSGADSPKLKCIEEIYF